MLQELRERLVRIGPYDNSFMSLRDLRTLFRHYYVITHTSPYAPRTTCSPAPQINPVLIEDSMFGLHISEQPPQVRSFLT
jgi:hypothetical protein